MLVIFAMLCLLGIGLLVLGAAALERVAGDRMVVEMRTWADDAVVVSDAIESPVRAA